MLFCGWMVNDYYLNLNFKVGFKLIVLSPKLELLVEKASESISILSAAMLEHTFCQRLRNKIEQQHLPIAVCAVDGNFSDD
jgi:hypothetical protein